MGRTAEAEDRGEDQDALSLGIVYDPFTISRARLEARLRDIEAGMGEIEEVPCRTRIQ